MKTSEQLDKLAEALSKAQGSFKNPEKNKIADIPMKAGGKYSYAYADLPEILDCARKGLADNGLSHSMGIRYDEEGPILAGRLLHSSGQWIESEYALPGGADDKALAASMTYGRRYIFTALIGVAADEDTDSAPEGNYTDKKPAQSYTSRPAKAAHAMNVTPVKPVTNKPIQPLWDEDMPL